MSSDHSKQRSPFAYAARLVTIAIADTQGFKTAVIGGAKRD